MTDKKICSIIHDALQSRDKWYLDHSISDDCPELLAITEKAIANADYRLTELSTSAIYGRYIRWRKSGYTPPSGEGYFESFLSDMAFDLGRDALESDEKLIYNDSIGINFKFLKS